MIHPIAPTYVHSCTSFTPCSGLSGTEGTCPINSIELPRFNRGFGGVAKDRRASVKRSSQKRYTETDELHSFTHTCDVTKKIRLSQDSPKPKCVYIIVCVLVHKNLEIAKVA